MKVGSLVGWLVGSLDGFELCLFAQLIGWLAGLVLCSISCWEEGKGREGKGGEARETEGNGRLVSWFVEWLVC